MNSQSKVLDWRKRRSWLASIPYYAGDLLSAEITQELVQERPECWSDNFSWLPYSEDILPEFVQRLTTYYSHFKGFHGCRPSSVRSYYERGLLGQNSDFLCDNFRQIFSDVPKKHLEAAIGQLFDRINSERGRSWFIGCDKYLLRYCGHYLIQGSEFVMSLAAQLHRSATGEDYRFRLRNYGTPTIFEVDIPVSLIPQEQHLAVAKMILSEWGQLISRRPLGFGDEPPCYVVRQDIPPECIRDHIHPAKIEDPHKSRLTYVNLLRTCDFCS